MNKGSKHTEESKKKMVETRKKNGNLGLVTEETRKKISKHSAKIWKGKKLTKEHVAKMVATRKKNGSYCPQSLERRKIVSRKLSGKNSHLWRGGRTKTNRELRWSMEGREWRTSIFKRDDFTCQAKDCSFCFNKRGIQNLQAHHIKKLSEYPELAHKLNNGITYCDDYHLGVVHNLKQLVVGGKENF